MRGGTRGITRGGSRGGTRGDTSCDCGPHDCRRLLLYIQTLMLLIRIYSVRKLRSNTNMNIIWFLKSTE